MNFLTFLGQLEQMGLASEKKTEECVNKIGQLEGKKFQTLKNLGKYMTISFLNPGQLERRGRTSLKNSEDCINTIGLLEGRKQNRNGKS